MEELYDIGRGRWQVPWGEINRFQRVSNAIVHHADRPTLIVRHPMVHA